MHIQLFAVGRNPEEWGVLRSTPQRRRVRITQPFGYAQGHEPVEWQMDVFRQPPRRGVSGNRHRGPAE